MIYKIKLSKKGGFQGYIVSLVIFLVIIVIMLGFLHNFKEKVNDKAFSEECNQYLKAHMIGKKLFDGSFSGGNENPCITQDVVVEEKDVYDITEKVADKMVECYNTFYRGEANLFSGEEDKQISFCSICHKIEFKEKELMIKNYQWYGFLSKTKYKTGEKYMEILGSKQALDKYLETEKENNNKKISLGGNVLINYGDVTVINTSKKYITLFQYNKTEGKTAIVTLIDGIKKGAMIGAGVVVIGAAIVLTAGGAVPFLTAAVIAGSATGAVIGGGSAFTKVRTGDTGSRWIASIQVVPYEVEYLKKIDCQYVVGMSARGVEDKPY